MLHSVLKNVGHIFTKLSALLHFVMRINASSLGQKVKVQGYDGSNMLEYALFDLVNAIS